MFLSKRYIRRYGQVSRNCDCLYTKSNVLGQNLKNWIGILSKIRQLPCSSQIKQGQIKQHKTILLLETVHLVMIGSKIVNVVCGDNSKLINRSSIFFLSLFLNVI